MSSSPETEPIPRGAARARVLAALLAAAVMSEMGFFIMPLLVGGITKAYHIGEAQVGFIITIQIAVFSCISLGLAPFVHRLPRRSVALGGAAAIIAGNLLTAIGADPWILIPARIITGLGEGTIQAMMAASAAETAEPDRTFALLALGIVVMSLTIFLGLPPVVAELGPHGTFGVIAGVAAIATPLLLWMPRASVLVHARPAPGREIWTPVNFAAMTALMFFCMSGNTVWFYVERISHHIGIDIKELGWILAIASFVALAGPIIAHRLSTRFGRTAPLLCAYAILGVGSLWVTLTSSPVVFTVAISLGSAAVMFGSPYHMGLLAALDRVGRLAAAARGFIAIGNTLAPAVAGMVLLFGGSYAGIGWTALVTAAIGSVLILPAALRGDRANRDSAAARLAAVSPTP